MAETPEPVLSAEGRALLCAALATDPALAEELALIDEALSPAARRRFWRAFAAELPSERPAALVLRALETAARG